MGITRLLAIESAGFESLKRHRLPGHGHIAIARASVEPCGPGNRGALRGYRLRDEALIVQGLGYAVEKGRSKAYGVGIGPRNRQYVTNLNATQAW